MTEARTLVETFVGALNTGETNTLRNIFWDDALVIGTPRGDVPALEALPGSIAGLRMAAPDLQATVEHYVANDKRIIARLSISGTNHGDMLGQRGTGKKFQFSEYWDAQVKDGKIEQLQVLLDVPSFAQQVG